MNKKQQRLPQTGLEAEALALRDAIAKLRSADLLGIGVPILHPDAGHIWLRQTLKRLAMSHPHNMTEVIGYARAGWKDADLALRELFAEHVDRGVTLPNVLAVYMVEITHPSQPRPSGRQKATAVMQDLRYSYLVWAATQRFPGLSVTRNRVAPRRSICAIVAIAVTEAGIGRPINMKAMEKVSARWSHVAHVA